MTVNVGQADHPGLTCSNQGTLSKSDAKRGSRVYVPIHSPPVHV